MRQLELAVAVGPAAPLSGDECPAALGRGDLFGETVTPLAGAGAPLVAEFAPAALAAALGISLDAGRAADRPTPWS